MDNPVFYLLSNVLGPKVTIEVIAIDTDHNLNVLFNFRRMKRLLVFTRVSKEEAYNELLKLGGAGIGCYIPGEGMIDTHMTRRKIAKYKAQLFMGYAKGYEPGYLIPVIYREPVKRESKPLLFIGRPGVMKTSYAGN